MRMVVAAAAARVAQSRKYLSAIVVAQRFGQNEPNDKERQNQNAERLHRGIDNVLLKKNGASSGIPGFTLNVLLKKNGASSASAILFQ